MLNAKSYALRLLAIRPRSVKEIKDKLALKGYAKEDADATVKELASRNYLNDLEYARAYLRDRTRNNPRGIAFLKMELRRKGISEETIGSALDEIKDAYDEREIARKIARARKKTLGAIDAGRARNRIHGYLARRGFSAQTIYDVLKEICASDEEIVD